MVASKWVLTLPGLFATWFPLLVFRPLRQCHGFLGNRVVLSCSGELNSRQRPRTFMIFHRRHSTHITTLTRMLNVRQEFPNSSSSSSSSSSDSQNHVDDAFLPPLPPKKQQPPPPSRSKTDLYSSSELLQLWQLHTSLSNTTTFVSSSTTTASPVDLASTTAVTSPSMSLHDLVVAETRRAVASSTTTTMNQPSSFSHPSVISAALARTRCIATDVDGTLLTSQHGLHPRTRNALHQALQAANDPNHPLQYVVLATGKTRTGALTSIGKADPSLRTLLSCTPGVFVQGLYCVNASGHVVWEQRLGRHTALAVEYEASQHWTNVTLLAYRGDEIFATAFSQPHHVVEVHEKYGEPMPQVIQSLEDLELDQRPGFVHKLLLMGDDPERLTTVVRPALQVLADRFGCEVTQAVPNMLELLPPHCSKAEGVRQLCHVLNDVDPHQHLVAIGDAENDIGLLDMAAVGFAVGNAVPAAQAVADVMLDETNDHGGAGVAIEQVLECLKEAEETNLSNKC